MSVIVKKRLDLEGDYFAEPEQAVLEALGVLQPVSAARKADASTNANATSGESSNSGDGGGGSAAEGCEAEQSRRLYDFVVGWRRSFVEALQPTHLPDGWSVDRPLDGGGLSTCLSCNTQYYTVCFTCDKARLSV